MIYNLLLKLVGQPIVLALAVHQVNFFWLDDQEDHSWYLATLLLKVRNPKFTN